MKFVPSVTLGILLTASSLVAQETGPELQRFRGHWEVVRLVEDGKVIPPNMIREWLPSGGQIEIAQNGILFKSPTSGEKEVRIFSIDGTKYPPTIDITTAEKEQTLGIYKFDENSLVVCLADPKESPRPQKFAAPEGSKHMLMVLRKKPAAPTSVTPAKPLPQPVQAAPAKVLNDQEAARLLVGTWKYVDSVGALYLTCFADGTFYTVREVKQLRLFQKTFVRNQIANGNWKLQNGAINLSVTGSIHPERIGTTTTFRLRSVSASEMIFSDAVGLVGTATRVK